MQTTHAVSAAAVAMTGGRSWWNRPMVWASLAAISYGGWLAARRGQRRREREDAEDAEYAQYAEYAADAEAPHPAVSTRTADDSLIDEAMNRLGRDWRPAASGVAGHPEEPPELTAP